MKTKTKKKMRDIRNAASTEGMTKSLLLVATLLLLTAGFAATARSQDQTKPSTDRDNPTPVASNVITGDGVDQKTEYFYTFNAGPGEITLTLDVKAEKDRAVSSVDIALFDAKSKKLISTYANPDHGSSKRAVETVKVRGTQPLLLEVTVSEGVDTFKIKLDGAVQFVQTVQAQPGQTQPASTPTPQSAPIPTTQGNSVTGQTDAQPTADAQPATDVAVSSPVTPATDASAQSSTTDASPAIPATSVAGSKSRAQKVQATIDSASSTSGSILGMISSAKESLKGLKPSPKGTPASATDPDVSAGAAPITQSTQENSSEPTTATQSPLPQRMVTSTSTSSSTSGTARKPLPMRPSSAPQVSANQLPVRTSSLPARNDPARQNKIATVQNQPGIPQRNIHLPSRPTNSAALTVESKVATPHITVRSEHVSAANRTGYVINVTNWNEFKVNKFVVDTSHPQILPPSPCDQSKGYRFVAQLYTDNGANSVCHNLPSSTDLMEIRTTAPTGTSLKGFYLVITN